MLSKLIVLITAGVFAFPVAAARAGSFHLALDIAGRQPVVVTCPPGSATDASCRSLLGAGVARGLGKFTAQARTRWAHRSSGGFDSTVEGSVTTAQGTLSFAGDNSAESHGKLFYAITFSGTGGLGSVTGSGSFNFIGALGGTGHFLIEGDLADPSNAFDLTPPQLTIRSASAQAVGSGRYKVTIRYTTDNATTATLSTSGSSRIIAAAAATGTITATLHVSVGLRTLRLRLVVADSSANPVARMVVVKLR